MIRSFDALHGNEKLKGFLAERLENGSLAHAYILEGPEGSGRHTLARLLTASLACTDPSVRPCGTCKNCRKILGGLCPDLITVGLPKDKKQIPIESIRALRDEAFITPNDLDFKVFVIENAECMNPASQNALLKVLEEPPSGVRFFLLTDRLPALLPTIRSRAAVLKMQVFDEDELASLLRSALPRFEAKEKADPRAIRRLLRSACGSYGRAVSLLSRRSDASGEEKALTALRHFVGSSRAEFLLDFSAGNPKREDMEQLLEDLSLALRDLLACRRAPGQGLLFLTDPEEAKTLSASLPLRTLYEAQRITQETLMQSGSNVNAQTALAICADRLWNCK